MEIWHKNNDNSKNPFIYLLITDMSASSLHDGTKSARDAGH